MHILLIEDDKEAAAWLARGLEENGYVVAHTADGEEGLHLALSGYYDMLIVDRMLPKRDGLSIIRMLRTDGKTTPALVLSALQAWNAQYGADDEGLAIDGKTMCNAIDEEGRQAHILSVVGHQTNACYTQKKLVPCL